MLFQSCKSAVDLSYYQAYPSHAEVVDWFFGKYNAQPKDNWQYTFIKDKEGYAVQLKEFAKEPQEDPVVRIWSAEKKEFLDADLRKGQHPSPQVQKGAQRTAMSRAHTYDENIFFGYDRWQDDVVEEFDGQSDLPDKFLNGLARAYASVSISQIDGRRSATLEHPYDKSLDPAEFSEDILDKHDEYAWKAIETFTKLKEANPDFPVIVGYPGIKLGHEHMTAWLDLSIIQQA
ncbi:MAG: hypothetical protein AAF570_17945, partial [Bacteroidota bacterium]